MRQARNAAQTLPKTCGPPARSARLLLPLLLLVALWFTFSYFHHISAGWNVNTRLALTYAVVEKGTLAIDAYHRQPGLETNDKAFYGGHFYCDKSPALSFMGAPIYYLAWQVRLRIDTLGVVHSRQYARWVFWTRYLLRVLTVSLAAALLGVILWQIGIRLGISPFLSWALSVGVLAGTVLFGYATLFYAYLPSALFGAAAYLLLLERRLSKTPLAEGWILFWSGLLVGLSWFFEYTAGLAGLGLTLYATWHTRSRLPAIWKFLLGGLLPVIAFYTYTQIVFEEFAIPYKYEYDNFFRQEMAKGFQGIHLPRLAVLYYITIHAFKGLFYYSPFLVLGLAGAWEYLTKPQLRPFRSDVWLCLAVIAAYLAFNSGYYMWWGGWAAGPRLLCPAIPFFFPLVALWLRTPRLWRILLFAFLLTISIQLNFMITAVDPQVPTGIDTADLLRPAIADDLPSPILNALYPAFFQGNLAYNIFRAATGVEGKWSLLPLGVFWLLTALILVYWRKRHRYGCNGKLKPSDPPRRGE
ncbi:hypothetical protein HQ520_03070 [bacterium]|nr:hypothetical protein [bacterium]